MKRIKHNTGIEPVIYHAHPTTGVQKPMIACKDMSVILPPDGRTELLVAMWVSEDAPVGVFVPFDKISAGRFIEEFKKSVAALPDPAKRDGIEA